MDDLAGKVAVITGAGAGIGRGTALALAEAGTHVVVADIDEEQAASVADEVLTRGVRSLAVRTDVTDRASIANLAKASLNEFGEVHILHNNAGVTAYGSFDDLDQTDWEWIRGVNLDSAVSAISIFLPHLRSASGETHIINTGSMASFSALPRLWAYNATKYAILALSETLHDELKGEGIGVSVLCPGGVVTGILENSNRLRPHNVLPQGRNNGAIHTMQPEEAGRIVVRGIRRNDLYIITHPEMVTRVQSRQQRILEAFERATSDRSVWPTVG